MQPSYHKIPTDTMKNNVNKERGKSPTKVFLKKSKKGVDKAEESGYTEEAVARDGP